MDNGSAVAYLKKCPTVDRIKLLIDIACGMLYLNDVGGEIHSYSFHRIGIPPQAGYRAWGPPRSKLEIPLHVIFAHVKSERQTF